MMWYEWVLWLLSLILSTMSLFISVQIFALVSYRENMSDAAAHYKRRYNEDLPEQKFTDAFYKKQEYEQDWFNNARRYYGTINGWLFRVITSRVLSLVTRVDPYSPPTDSKTGG